MLTQAGEEFEPSKFASNFLSTRMKAAARKSPDVGGGSPLFASCLFALLTLKRERTGVLRLAGPGACSATEPGWVWFLVNEYIVINQRLKEANFHSALCGRGAFSLR